MAIKTVSRLTGDISTNAPKLKLKGRKASLTLATFHAEHVTPAVLKACDKRKTSVKRQRKRRKRQSTRFYLAPNEYVSTAPIARPNEYELVAYIHLGFDLVPDKDKGGFKKVGGRYFRAETTPKTLEDGRKWLKSSFLSWCRKYGYTDKWHFHFTTDRQAGSLTMAVERAY